MLCVKRSTPLPTRPCPHDTTTTTTTMPPYDHSPAATTGTLRSQVDATVDLGDNPSSPRFFFYFLFLSFNPFINCSSVAGVMTTQTAWRQHHDKPVETLTTPLRPQPERPQARPRPLRMDDPTPDDGNASPPIPPRPKAAPPSPFLPRIHASVKGFSVDLSPLRPLAHRTLFLAYCMYYVYKLSFFHLQVKRFMYCKWKLGEV